MVFKEYNLKLECTLNGDGWDKPVGVMGGRKEFCQPQVFDVGFPNADGKNTESIHPTDIIRVYAGFGAVEDDPVFTGVFIGDKGKNPIWISFVSMLGLFEHDRRTVTEWNNFDGVECGYALYRLLDSYDFSMFNNPLSFNIQGTYPVVVVPDSIRHSREVSKLSIIKEINNLCIDTSDYPNPPLEYFFYESNLNLYHRKMQPTDGSIESPFVFGNIDHLAYNRRTTLRDVVTRQTVVGTTYTDAVGRSQKVQATHEDDSAIGSRRLFHAPPIIDSTIQTSAQCRTVAKEKVEAGKYKTVSVNIDSLTLLHAIPGLSLVEVEESRFGLEGIHVVRDMEINLGMTNQVTATLDVQKPLPASTL